MINGAQIIAPEVFADCLRHPADEHVKAKITQQLSVDEIAQRHASIECVTEHGDGVFISECLAKFFIIQRVHVDSGFFAWNDDVFHVFSDRYQRACFDVIVTSVGDKVFDCLTGKRLELHFIKDDGRKAFMKLCFIQELELEEKAVKIVHIAEELIYFARGSRKVDEDVACIFSSRKFFDDRRFADSPGASDEQGCPTV